MSRYLDADTHDVCDQHLRNGGDLDELASKLHFDPFELTRLLQVPALEPIPEDDEFDLWRSDELDGKL